MFGWFRSRRATVGGGTALDNMAERAQRLLDDLHTLEINTIQNVAMTARRMPPLPTAIAEIADVYTDWLTETLHEQRDEANGSEECQALFKKDRQYQFKRLRDASAKISNSNVLTPEEKVIARRIFRNSIALKTLCKEACEQPDAQPYFTDMTLHDLYGTPDSRQEMAWRPALDDRAKVRKIWEVRTEMVLMQSMIQLEGDVVTRFSPLVSDQSNRQVIEIHQQAIKTSTRMWSVLIEAVASLAKVVLAPSKPGP